MSRESFLDAALILVGHGSSVDDDAGATVRQHAAQLRKRGIFGEVREAYWKQEPQAKEVLANLKQARLFVVPVFISEGYFSDEVIPRELGFSEVQPGGLHLQARDGQKLVYCKAIGTHEKMGEVLVARAREVVGQFPFPRLPRTEELTLFIGGHGTSRNANSRKAIELQASRIRSLGVFADVHAAFLEEEPRIGLCYDLARTRKIVLVPFLIGDGLHTRKDIPIMLGERESVVEKRLKAGRPVWRNPTERHGKLVWYAEVAGSSAAVVDVIMERVREGAETGSLR